MPTEAKGLPTEAKLFSYIYAVFLQNTKQETLLAGWVFAETLPRGRQGDVAGKKEPNYFVKFLLLNN
jgi:hypothetical protein